MNYFDENYMHGLHVGPIGDRYDTGAALYLLTEKKKAPHREIKVADYIIDLGPESGDNGGEIIAKGTPEQVAKVKGSYTGQFIKPLLDRAKKNGQYAKLEEFIDTEKLELEALEISTGPKVRRKIKE